MPTASTAAAPPRLRHAGSSDSNERFLVELADGAAVECVVYRGDTLCVSSQVGCAVACPFCASGARGLSRPLRFDELVGQLEGVLRLGFVLRRVTVSGIGEPLHNPKALGEFIGYCRAAGLRASFTSSGGPLPRLREWLHGPHNGLTLSVHAGSERVRARLVPNAPSLEQLFGVLAEEDPRMTQRRRRKTALAYLLVQGENEHDDEIDAFIARARPLGFAVHLYAYNPVPTSTYARLPEPRYREVYARMHGAGLRVRMSSQARLERNGGCGTLVALHRQKPEHPVATP